MLAWLTNQVIPNELSIHRHTRVYEDDSFVGHFSNRGAREIIVMDGSGKPIRSTVSQRRSYLYATQFKALTSMARNVVRDLDPSNDITFMRMRSNSLEVHLSMTTDFIVAVIQRLRKKK